MMITPSVSAASNSMQVTEDSDYLSQLSELIQKNDGENYIGSLNLTIGSDTMILDGTELKIDDDGSTPIIENDTTLLSIRGVAEAIGADVTSGFGKIKIMPLKTADSSGSSYSTLINAATKYATDHGAKVINLSMGGYHDDTYQRQGIEYAISHGVTVVAAAGNDNVDISKKFFSPACINGVVTVAAVADNNQKAKFSNYGNGIIDIAAPGVKIGGAARGGGTVTMNGTSMASPHIAGVLALIRSANPNYSSTDAINAMKSSASNLGSSAYYGAGIPNLENLVSKTPVENNITVTFNLSAFTNDCSRTTKLMFTHGEVGGNSLKNVIEVHNFGDRNHMIIHPKIIKSGHGGGDFKLMEDFIKSVNNGESHIKTSAIDSIESHVMPFAAEYSRLNHKVVDINKFLKHKLEEMEK